MNKSFGPYIAVSIEQGELLLHIHRESISDLKVAKRLSSNLRKAVEYFSLVQQGEKKPKASDLFY
jgi:hypothetical protein